MEITKVFKATVKAVKARRKDLHKEIGSNILPKSKPSSDKKGFHQAAVDVATSISKLRDFLLKYQLEYLGEFSHLISISSRMTEEERDQIDTDTQILIRSCSSAISSLKDDVDRLKENGHFKLHATAVVELLELYLKDICKLYAKQKAFRIKQTVDRNRMTRLQPDINDKVTKQINEISIKNHDNSKEAELKKEIEIEDEEISKKESKPTDNASELLYTKDTLPIDENEEKDEYNSLSISPEEMQMFEEENETLYLELNNTVKEVRNIEGKVVEISHLQDIFQEKVMAQSTQIEKLYETAVETTENVKEGNEEIREAIKNSATFRVWILFFLVMCTFSLLFLDWYNY